MQLKVAIVGQSEGWKHLLLQEGVPHSIVTDSLLPDDFSVAVVSDDVDDRESEMLRQYLTLGGAVLCSAKVYARIRQTTAQVVSIKYLYPDYGSKFHSLGIIDIYTRCQLAWNANELRTNRGIVAAHIGTYGDGYIIALPFNPAEIAIDCRTAIKSFYSPERRLPFEKVSLVSKGEIRTLVSQCLELLHHHRGLPYVHLWYYPNGTRSLFIFRIDTDGGTEEQIKDLYILAHRNNIPATWFIDAKNNEKIMKLFSEMEGQEIGVHCFEHQVFPDYKRNNQNIQRAQAIMQGIGLTSTGFAAPFGSWNEQLSHAITDCGFEYSSEFSFDYDNLPNRPRLSTGNGVLQVPIHPICIGNLKRHSYGEEQMIRYFAEVIQRKLFAREPIIMYHHPRDGYTNILDWLFQEIRREHIPVKTMVEYARWWKIRLASIPEMDYSDQSLRLLDGQVEKSVQVHITKPDGTEAIIPMAGQIMLETVRWDPKPMAWIIPDDYLRTRRFNYRVPLVRSLDTVTNIFSRK